MARRAPIVVGTDFSSSAEEAVAHARRLAVTLEADLVVAHVSPTAEPVSGAFSVEAGERARRDQLELAARRLEELGASAPPTIRIRLEEGEPGPRLVATAEEESARLLVIGASGEGEIARWLLGSAADRAIRTSSVDILVARGEPRPLRRLLVPTDFDELARSALEVASRLLEEGGHIDLLHCWLPPPTVTEAASGLTDVQATVRERGEAAARAAGPRVRFVERSAPPGAGIGQQLECGDYDLVVMGASGREGVRRLLVGSVAENTARHAPCSVLLVKGW